MTERDVIALLSEANPVRVDDLAQAEFPRSILLLHGRPSRRLVLAVASVAAAVAALVGVFAFGSDSPQTGGSPGGVANPIAPVPIALSNASAALGAPVVLPNTPLLKPSDAGQATKECDPGEVQESGCVVTVSFPSQDVTIRYGRYGPPYTDPLPEYEASIAEDTVPRSIVYLGGTPAYLTPKEVESPGSGSTIHFQLGETTIGIFAQNYDGASVETLAQSIIDRSPPAELEHGEAALANASTVLGGSVVLPDTSFAGPSDAASTVSTACPAPDRPGATCQVTVDFPTSSLTIRYMRGVHDGSQPPPSFVVRNRYEAVVTHSQIGAQLVELHGTPALFVPSQSSAPAWIEFFVRDVDVRAQGGLDQTTLQAVARSILERSGS
jgi:hypothetical protein